MLKLWLAASAALFAVGAGFHLLVPVAFPEVAAGYADAALFRPWEGWTSTYMTLHPAGFGAAFAGGYAVLRRRGAVPAGWRAGLGYGLGVFLIGALPVFLVVFAAVRLPPAVVALWAAQAGCQYLAAGAAVGAVPRPVRAIIGERTVPS